MTYTIEHRPDGYYALVDDVLIGRFPKPGETEQEGFATVEELRAAMEEVERVLDAAKDRGERT